MAVAQKSFNGTSRRSLLTGGLAGGLLLAFHLPVRAVNEPVQPADNTDGKFAPNAFIRIDSSGKTTLVMPQVEMGQGVYTSISMILAEELDADFSQVTLEHAPPSDNLYGNPMFGIQATGNSNSVRAWWKPLRMASASARAMLIQAAAEQWSVEPASCTTANSDIIHKESGRKLSYGALVDAANTQTPPKDVPLKDPKDFVLIGKPLKRLDTPDKVNGKAVYGIDAMLPDMKFATLKVCPVFGGKLAKVDDSAARKVPGVHKVVVLDDLVAVIGDHMWAAKKGLDALVIDWAEGPNAGVSSKDIWQDLRAASEKDGAVAKSVGDIKKGLAIGERLEAAYELPFLAHATMEPVNATVHLKSDSCEIWTGTQVIARVQSEAAKAAGLPVEKVVAHNHLLGGGFGRKLEPDMVVAAVRIAKHVDGPVKVVWTREEDIQHDIYRPVYRDTIAASRPTERSSAGNIASAARRSWRAGFRRDSRMASISTVSIAPSTSPTTSRTCMSSLSGPNRRRCRPGSGAESVPTTMCLRSNVSWTSWRERRARIRLSSAARCWEPSRAFSLRSISRRKNPVGANRCRRGSGVVSVCSRRLPVLLRPSWKPK
jgi:isoquinoline 1-oxidoreductase beta subunit